MGFSSSLIYSRDTLTFDDVKTGLLREKLWDQMKELGDGSSDASSGHGFFMEKERYTKKENKGRSKSRNLGWRGKSKERKGKCYICKKPSQWKNECPDKEKAKKEVASLLVAVESGVGEGDLDVLSAVASDVSCSKWVDDLRASYHMIPNRNCFSSYVDK